MIPFAPTYFYRNFRLLFFVLFLLGVLGFFLVNQTLFAQVGEDEVNNRRAQLEAELAQLEAEIEEQRQILQVHQREAVSLERDIAILDAQIQEHTLSIRARDLTIQKLNTEIGHKEEYIGDLSEKLSREKESLAQLLRKTNEIDDFSLVEVILSNKDLSEFFVDLDSYNAIKESLQKSFVVIEETKDVTHAEKTVLEEKSREESELRALQALQRARIEDKKDERQNLLAITKGEEERYQQIIQTIEKDAATIRAELFTLRGTAAIPFGEALELANKAHEQTGVRPAFLLGIIAEESNLGENVGNCNLPEDPPKYKWYNIMKAPRDTEPYVAITQSLGLDPDLMPLSCKPWYGYGGAMGPAQFIASTWALFAGYDRDNNFQYNANDDRIGALTGNQPPNPWDPEDAFMASAVLLRDNGATKTTSTCTITSNPEECAALRYFAGWKNANKPSYRFYGQDVIELARHYQEQINILEGN